MFEYRRTWYTNGLRNLSAMTLGVLFIAVMVVIGIQFGPSGRAEFLCFAIPSAAIGAALAIGFAKQLYWDLTLRGDFRFTVTTQSVACECPGAGRGDSFTLPYQAIQEVRIETAGYDADRFVVVDRSGQMHRVSGSHGTPVIKILDAIHDASPSTRIVQYGRLRKNKTRDPNSKSRNKTPAAPRSSSSPLHR